MTSNKSSVIEGEAKMQPAICDDTLKSIVTIINDRNINADMAVDLMTEVVQRDPFWATASAEQCEEFITRLLRHLVMSDLEPVAVVIADG